MTTVLSGINCSIASSGGEISKATAACVDAADRAAGRAATKQVAAIVAKPRARTTIIKRFILVSPEEATIPG
jgi:hypothetical protein